MPDAFQKNSNSDAHHASTKRRADVTESPSIIFLGTPEFAVPSLEALHRSPFELKWVITQPDRPKGRGRRLTAPPVKQRALELGYDVWQLEDIRNQSFIQEIKMAAPTFLVVVAFGQILPLPILSIAQHGAVNVHASLLPKYRGPAPIQWAIMRGEKTTGITTMLMDHGVDTGDMLLQAQTAIKSRDTAASLHDRLSHMGADLLVETLDGIWRGKIFPRMQKHEDATYAPMLEKENGRIQWHHGARTIDALIRAMTPWPGAYCHWNKRRYKIHKACAIESTHQHQPPGSVVPGFADELRIATGEGVLLIQEIQGASGKTMSIKQFLHGNPISPGAVFT
jgi:methionyl-tRNA formyltransferase